MMQPHRRAEAEVACSCPTCDIRLIQSLIYHAYEDAYGDTSYVYRRL